MTRLLLLTGCLAALATPVARAAEAKKAPPAKPAPAVASAGLGAAQIAERNVKARGGLKAWRAVRALKITGEVEAGGTADPKLPYTLYLQRPRRSRLELTFAGQNAVQVYDGTQGWKLRPYLNRDEVEPFRPEELAAAGAAADLDAPLVDYAAKGTRIELVGTEAVEGKKAYKLALTLQGGERRFVWVDAATFLDVKASGQPRKLDGRPHAVAIISRDFRTVGGIKIPFVQETVVEGVKQGRRMVVKAAAINPPLQEALFAKPTLAMARAPAR